MRPLPVLLSHLIAWVTAFQQGPSDTNKKNTLNDTTDYLHISDKVYITFFRIVHIC